MSNKTRQQLKKKRSELNSKIEKYKAWKKQKIDDYFRINELLRKRKISNTEHKQLKVKYLQQKSLKQWLSYYDKRVSKAEKEINRIRGDLSRSRSQLPYAVSIIIILMISFTFLAYLKNPTGSVVYNVQDKSITLDINRFVPQYAHFEIKIRGQNHFEPAADLITVPIAESYFEGKIIKGYNTAKLKINLSEFDVQNNDSIEVYINYGGYELYSFKGKIEKEKRLEEPFGIKELSYTYATEEIEEGVTKTKIQQIAVVGKPVKWVEQIKVKKLGKQNISIEIPEQSFNITAFELEQGKQKKIESKIEVVKRKKKITFVKNTENASNKSGMKQISGSVVLLRPEQGINVLTRLLGLLKSLFDGETITGKVVTIMNITENISTAINESTANETQNITHNLINYSLPVNITNVTINNTSSTNITINRTLDITNQTPANITNTTINIIPPVDETMTVPINKSLPMNKTSVVPKLYKIVYFTPGPKKTEKIINDYKKLVSISSDTSYKNILVTTNITETSERLVVHWLINGTRQIIPKVIGVDSNNNSLIDQIQWIAPYGGNQIFEVDLTILNVQSYPTLGGEWMVAFETTGAANLTITPYDNTTFTEFLTDNLNTDDDLKFLELRCGDVSLKNETLLIDNSNSAFALNSLNWSDSLRVKSLFVENYSCDETGYLTNKVIAGGEHNILFEFGGVKGTAHNFVSELYCNVTTSCAYTDVFHISNLSNAHAELSNESNYPNIVCCHEVYGEALSNNCSDPNAEPILNISSTTNAHVEKVTAGNYHYSVCLTNESNKFNVSCGYATDCTAAGYDTCVASISSTETGGDTNLQVADCITNPYATKVCCKAEANNHNPTITVDAPPAGTSSASGNYTVNWTASDPDVGDGLNISCYADTNSSGYNKNYTCFENVTNDGTESCNISSWAEGAYYIWCNASDGTLSATDYSEGSITNKAGYCNGNYLGGDWVINSSITCSDEVIPVNGSLTIQDDSEVAVTNFSSLSNGAYDLSGEATAISAAIPDLDKTTPAQYTADWDTNANHEFYIAMNESEHKIQIFTNNSDSQTKYYGFDIDKSKSSGGSLNGFTGLDFAIGYLDQAILLCYNESNPNPVFFNLSAGEGSTTCGNVTGWDSDFNGNFTVYWNNSDNALEVVIDVTGGWVDKESLATDGINSYYTKFKNSALLGVGIGLGNLTLDNITLDIGDNLDVTGLFTIKDSRVEFQLTGNGTANMTFNAGSVINVNNSVLTSNSSFNWGWRVSTGSYNITNNNISYNGFGDGRHYNRFDASTGGLVYNNIFSNCTGNANIKIANDNTGMNISSNTFFDSPDTSIYFDGHGKGITVENNDFYGGVILRTSAVTNINLTSNTFRNWGGILLQQGTSSNIIKNNNFSAVGLLNDDNLTGNNTIIYSNQYGEIKWGDKGNLTIGASLYLGDKVYVEDNKLGLADDGNLANLNSTAQLTFYGLNSTTHQLYKKGVRCDNTSACNITYDSGGIVAAEISSFSNYSTQQANTLPIVENVTLNSTHGTNYSNENLTVYWDTYDTDGDNITNITNWYLNSNSIAVLNMPFEGGSTSGTVSANGTTRDYSSYGNNGTVNGATWNATGGYDGFGAYEFDGVDDHISIPLIDDAFPLTVCMWVYAANFDRDGVLIARNHAVTARDFAIGFFASTNKIYFSPSDAAATKNQANISLFTNNAWNHLCAVYQADLSNSLYINSVDRTESGGTYFAPRGNVIGDNFDQHRFLGTIDEVMIYNRTLSAEEIKALYENRTDLMVSQETSAGEVWKACMTPNDGAEDGVENCSNNLTVASLSAPVLVSPLKGNKTVDRTPTFVWNNSVGGTKVTYELMVDNNISFGSPEIQVGGINETINQTNYTSSTELEVDTIYYWKVRGNDSGSLSNWSSVFNLTVESYISISVIRNTVDFGMINPNEVNDTADNNPLPFLIENTGNIPVNITVTGTRLFNSVSFPADYFQFKIGENETGAYNQSLSTTSWTNITNSSSAIDAADLDWHDAKDAFETDLKVRVPSGESRGAKSSTVTFTTR